jgi:small conductance mechanosensitive channel
MRIKARSFVLYVLLLLAPAVLAQETGNKASGEDPLVVEARSLIDKIDGAIADIDDLETQLDSAQNEGRILVNRQLVETRLQGLADVHRLCDNVVKQEQEGLDPAPFRSRVESLLTGISPRIREHIDEIEESLLGSRDSGALATTEIDDADERGRLGRRLLDKLYQALLDHLRRMEAFGLDTTEETAFLTEHLARRADRLTAGIGLARDRISGVQQRLKGEPGNPDLLAALKTSEGKLEAITDSLVETVALMNEVGLETTDHQKLLIETTGDISTGLLDKAVAVGLLQQWTDDLKNWVAENGPHWFFKSLLLLLILFVFRVLARVTRKVVQRSLDASKLDLSQLLRSMIVATVGNGVMFLGLLVALSQIGFSLGPVLAGLGVAGFIVGFALQDTLSNFASGMMILLYRPYDVGDLIEAGGVFGKVSRMSLVSTTFLTLDNQTLVVPNSKIWGDVIKNVTAQKVRRVDMTFGISYGDDIPHAEKVLEAIVAEHPKVLDDPAPTIRLHKLGDSSVDFVVRPWVATDDYWEVYWDVTREVKMRFDREGVSIPFPQRDVHVYREQDPPRSAEV